MPLLESSPRKFSAYTLGERRTNNQTDSDVTCSRSCDQDKFTRIHWKI